MAKAADMVIQINVSAPGLEAAIKALTDTIAGSKIEQTSPAVKIESVMPAPVQKAPAAVPTATPAPVQEAPAPAPAAVPTAAPAPAPAPAPAVVPTAPAAPAQAPVQNVATPTALTLEAICNAGASLIQTNPDMMQSVLAILPKYGVPAINLVKPEQFEAVAADLRALGAAI